jgi:hypothetical protein
VVARVHSMTQLGRRSGEVGCHRDLHLGGNGGGRRPLCGVDNW